jgi:porin
MFGGCLDLSRRRWNSEQGKAPRRARASWAAVWGFNCLLAHGSAWAQAPGQSSPVASSPGPKPAVQTNAGLLNSLSSANNLFGDMGGLRPWLAGAGISYGITETSEVLGNLTGGVHTGAAYEGLTLLSAGLDTSKAFGWRGGTFNVSALWIHGRNLSADNLYDIQTASGIEAQRAFRLWELWFDQTALKGLVDIKIGQQSIDQEFITSTYSTLFINTMMGWPALPSYDMYGGGPAYPLSSPGVRIRASSGPFTGLLGVFDDNPPGGPIANDSPLRGRERTGTAFNLNTGALVIGEVQYAINQPPATQNGAGSSSGGLAGTFRIGAWFDSAAFPDQRYDTNGLSLADPASNGDARPLRHNFGVYFSGDQAVWQQKGAARQLGLFTRLVGAPADRNLISFSTNLGLVLKAPLAARPNDSLGLGYGLAKVSDHASALDQDRQTLAGEAAYPVRSSESFIELTYQAQIAPWWLVQPDVQYVFTPGAGIPRPGNPADSPAPRLGNEAILGIRTNVIF